MDRGGDGIAGVAPGFLLRTFATKVGPAAVRELEELVSAELGAALSPSPQGLGRDVVYSLSSATVLAFWDQVSSDPEELWIAIGAKCVLLELARALSERVAELHRYSMTGDTSVPSGLREVWLATLPEQSAAGLRRFAEEARREALEEAMRRHEQGYRPRDLAGALAEDLIETGGLFEAMGDEERGTVIREAGERFREHLRRLEGVETLWESCLFLGAQTAGQIGPDEGDWEAAFAAFLGKEPFE